MNSDKKLSTLVKALRIKLQMTQYEFGQAVEVREQNISRYERGIGAPDPPIFDKIIRFAEEMAPEFVPALVAEFGRVYGAAAIENREARLPPEREALLAAFRALLADSRHAGKVSDKLSSILLDLQEKGHNAVAQRRKVQ